MTSNRLNAFEVAVIGAGPYGLSVAAHLRQAGFSTRVFGAPMLFWRQHMPKGMRLRSPWRATHISDPRGAFSIDVFASQGGADCDKPLMVEGFVTYGEWFCAHAVPDIDRRTVRQVDCAGNVFRLELTDGETFTAQRVVVATGLANQKYRPPTFQGLPARLVSHTSEHTDFTPFQGKQVAVIGRGQSAAESAILLSEAGAEVELISRGEVHWLGATDQAVRTTAIRAFRDALAAPSAVGPFPLSWLAEAPALVRRMPIGLRTRFAERCLRAGAAGWLKPRAAKVRFNSGRNIVGARLASDQIVIELDNGKRSFDHAVLGTGYRTDISRIGILSPQLLRRIASADGSPLLNIGLESSVPNLHFVGSYAVKSFGPLMRFIAGAPYAARAVTAAAIARGALREAKELPHSFLRSLPP